MVDSCRTNSRSKIQQPTTNNRQPKKLLKRIRKCEALIENLKTLPYYTVFKLRGQQQKDIAKAERKLHSLQLAYRQAGRSEQFISNSGFPSLGGVAESRGG